MNCNEINNQIAESYKKVKTATIETKSGIKKEITIFFNPVTGLKNHSTVESDSFYAKIQDEKLELNEKIQGAGNYISYVRLTPEQIKNIFSKNVNKSMLISLTEKFGAEEKRKHIKNYIAELDDSAINELLLHKNSTNSIILRPRYGAGGVNYIIEDGNTLTENAKRFLNKKFQHIADSFDLDKSEEFRGVYNLHLSDLTIKISEYFNYKKEKESERNEIFAKAKKSGRAQAINTIHTHDEKGDFIKEIYYATPNGDITTEVINQDEL